MNDQLRLKFSRRHNEATLMTQAQTHSNHMFHVVAVNKTVSTFIAWKWLETKGVSTSFFSSHCWPLTLLRWPKTWDYETNNWGTYEKCFFFFCFTFFYAYGMSWSVKRRWNGNQFDTFFSIACVMTLIANVTKQFTFVWLKILLIKNIIFLIYILVFGRIQYLCRRPSGIIRYHKLQ